MERRHRKRKTWKKVKGYRDGKMEELLYGIIRRSEKKGDERREEREGMRRGK